MAKKSQLPAAVDIFISFLEQAVSQCDSMIKHDAVSTVSQCDSMLKRKYRLILAPESVCRPQREKTDTAGKC